MGFRAGLPPPRCGNVTRRSFAHRAESFGLERADAWSLGALRLLFHAPRVYEPLVDAWEGHHPGTRRALDRLVAAGFVSHQGPVIVDVASGSVAGATSRRVARYRATARGAALARRAATDLGLLYDTFPRLSDRNAEAVGTLLDTFDVERARAPEGISAAHAIAASGLPARTGRWWVRRLVDGGWIRDLGITAADRREAIPAHWRVTRMLCRQLIEVLDSYPEPHGVLTAEFKLRRTRFLGDIDPSRVLLSGATDFDHDVEAQRILAAMLASPKAVAGGVFDIEPRIQLAADPRTRPWRFSAAGSKLVFYQPDALMTERDGGTRRSVLEYERFQSRRDAWSHIERFLGYLHAHTLPFEPAVLRFVVDTDARLRAYVRLIESFADYALDHPERMPANAVVLAASSVQRVRDAATRADALSPTAWFRIPLPNTTTGERACVLHDPAASPYDEYFARDQRGLRAELDEEEDG